MCFVLKLKVPRCRYLVSGRRVHSTPMWYLRTYLEVPEYNVLINSELSAYQYLGISVSAREHITHLGNLPM